MPYEDPFEKTRNLKWFLRQVQHYEDAENYSKRHEYIIYAMSAAQMAGLSCWFDTVQPTPPTPNNSDVWRYWFEAWIELPSGRVSWILPFSKDSTVSDKNNERSRRIDDFIATKSQQYGQEKG